MNTPTSKVVGVFMNQPLSYVVSQQQKLGLDVVQLHGSEPLGVWYALRAIPMSPGANLRMTGTGIKLDHSNGSDHHTLPLLDSGAGGSGELLEESGVKKVLDSDEGLRVMTGTGIKLDHSNGSDPCSCTTSRPNFCC
jgi:anthranilate synthase/indole-3-glycerol phosphate synthase/phosphoribosylanthranilate isomerase